MSISQAPLLFGNYQQSGLDELAGASPLSMNVVSAVVSGSNSELGTSDLRVGNRGTYITRRPGIQQYAGAPTTAIDAGGLSAIYVTVAGVMYVIGGTTKRSIYVVDATGSKNLSNVSQGDLPGTTRPVIAETSTLLAITGGGRAQKIDLTAGTCSPLLTAPAGKFVCANSARLLIDDPVYTSVANFSAADFNTKYDATSGYEVWNGAQAGAGNSTLSGSIRADAKPDPLVALGENTDEIWLWGSRSVQTYTPDGSTIVTGNISVSTTWAPVGSQEIGCIAPYSVIRVDQNFAWLDHHRRFVASDGKTISSLSDDIQQTLNDLAVVSDCFGYRFNEGPFDCLIWTFPTAGITLCYQTNGGWSQWSQQSASNNWAPFPAACHHRRQDTQENLIGTADGYMLQLKNGTPTDYSTTLGAATNINAFVTTGFLNHGGDGRKQCRVVRLALRRGTTTAVNEPVALLSWRDDTGPFGPPVQIGLGNPNDRQLVVSLRNLGGTYRRRQWKFEFMGPETFILAGAAEEFDTLES